MASWSRRLSSLQAFVLFAAPINLLSGSESVGADVAPGLWSNKSAAPEMRARWLVDAMTLQEKLSMLHGTPDGQCQCAESASCAYVGNIAGVPRLGIPPITMNDGPQGFRHDLHKNTSTTWPSSLTMAASWDEDLVFEWGAGMGKEFYKKGANLQLGPGLCLARVPVNGRNFEYLSGEDPFLGYTLAKPAIRGIQSKKVVANAKHWVLNNQETARDFVSSEADERTRFEMYYPAYEGAIEAGVGSFMCGYNKIAGIYSCENPETLRDLKQKLAFRGWVMSDWGAAHSPSVMAGMDVEQPGSTWMNEQLLGAGLAAGTVSEQKIDDAVARILLSLFAVGVMDEPIEAWDWRKLKQNVTDDDSAASARRLSAQSTVLLKNDAGLLPLRSGLRIAVIGRAGADTAVIAGGGSGAVTPSFLVPPVDGIRAAAGERSHVEYVSSSAPVKDAVAAAAAADVSVVFVGTFCSEGSDRKSLSLDSPAPFAGQNDLVAKVAKASPHVVVVVSAPGAVIMPWAHDVSAILVNFLPGQQVGHAVADVLFGSVNPSARLPITFPNQENETHFTQEQYPGVPDAKHPPYVYYSEKLLVGYRFYEEKQIEFSLGFPFGHGLSYTAFEYGNLVVSQLSGSGPNVSFAVRNSGSKAGAEVAQLYLRFPSSAGEPPLQLKGFRKTRVLAPGESEEVALQLRVRDISIWDVRTHGWTIVPGKFLALVGASSRDIRLQRGFAVGADGGADGLASSGKEAEAFV